MPKTSTLLTTLKLYKTGKFLHQKNLRMK